MVTNLYGYPAEYEFEPSDPFLLVPDEFIIEVLMRLEVNDARIEFLRAINCDDDYVKRTVRAELYADYPGAIGSFMEWWEKFIEARDGVVPCSVLPGPPWELRTHVDENTEGEAEEAE
jgi:hypothetical protein